MLRNILDNQVEVQWQKLEKRYSHSHEGSPDEVHIGFKNKGRFTTIDKNKSADQVGIRIGVDIAQLMHWKKGDSIEIFHHPDDLLILSFEKTENK